MQTSKYSSPYALVKDPIESTKVYSLYDARNKATGQMWLAKVLDNNVIAQLQMDDHVSYNEQVLSNLKDKEHVIYLSQIFIKADKTFIIQEKFETRLSTYLQKQVTIKAGEVEAILKDVYQGMCDIYEERYVHCNLRSEHIVRVAGEEGQPIWKIESLVLDASVFPIETLFTWKESTASLEDKRKQRELEEEMLDAQMVWNFGYLAVEMLIGSFQVGKMLKDSDVQWNRLRELTKDYPKLYELVNGCFRFNFKDRMSLKRFLDLPLFEDVARLGIADFFMTASKVFKTSTASSFLNSVNLRTQSRNNGKSTNLKSGILKNAAVKAKAHVYFQKMEEIKEEVYDQQGSKDLYRYCFLVNSNSFVTSVNSGSESASKMNENRVVIEHFLLRLAGKVQEKVGKSRSFEERVAKMREEIKSKVNNNSMVMKRIKEKDNGLIQKYRLELKKAYSFEELVVVCSQLCGYAYSRLRDECQARQDAVKLRAMAYFSIVAYMMNVQDWSELQGLVHDKNSDYWQFFKSCEVDALVKTSQKILRDKFELN